MGKYAVRKYVLGKILKLIKHPIFCFEYIILFILNTKFTSFFLVHQNGENVKSKWSLFRLNDATWKLNVSPLFSKPNIIFQFFFLWVVLIFGQKMRFLSLIVSIGIPPPWPPTGVDNCLDRLSSVKVGALGQMNLITNDWLLDVYKVKCSLLHVDPGAEC